MGGATQPNLALNSGITGLASLQQNSIFGEHMACSTGPDLIPDKKDSTNLDSGLFSSVGAGTGVQKKGVKIGGGTHSNLFKSSSRVHKVTDQQKPQTKAMSLFGMSTNAYTPNVS